MAANTSLLSKSLPFRLGLGAGLLAAGALCVWQYFGPLDYIGLANLAPLFGANLIVGIAAGTVAWVVCARITRRGAVLVLSTVLLVAVWGQLNLRRDIDVIVFVSDAIRPDHLSVYGYHRDTTPALERLAEEPGGVLFGQAVAQASYTWGGTPAILASLYPTMHGVLRFRQGLPEEMVTIGEALQETGYATCGIVANPHLASAKNFDQGFDYYEDTLKWGGAPNTEKAVEMFFEWWDHAERSSPLFGLIFVVDCHGGMYPASKEDVQRFRPEFDLTLERWSMKVIMAYSESERQDLIAFYDASLRFVDDHMGALLGHLRDSKRLANTVFVFTSDHGEAFWEHGTCSHGRNLHEEMIRIPMVAHFPSPVRFPEIRPVVVEPGWPVGQIDLMPTILHFVGGPRDIPAMRGRSLLPYLYGRASFPPGRGMLSERAGASELMRSWRRGEWKYIAHYNTPTAEGPPRKQELYNLSQDPGELENVADTNTEAAERCRREMAHEARAMQPHVMTPVAAEVTEEQLRRLKAMGYLK